MSYQIIQHDCELHTHSCHSFGPFDDRAAAEAFIDEYDLWLPSDGGYAFAVAVPAEPDATFDTHPDEWVELMVELYADTEPDSLNRDRLGVGATTSTTTKGVERGR